METNIKMKQKQLIYLFVLIPYLSFSQTFTEVHPIPCNDTLYIGNLGYPTWNAARILKTPRLGHAMLLGDFVAANLLQYQSPPCVSGRDTVVIECAHATQITCDTGIYIFEINCPENLSPVYPYEMPCNDSIYTNNLSAWWFPQLLTNPKHGFANVYMTPTDGAGVFYRPNPGFEGLDAVKVTFGNFSDTVLFVFKVYCNLVSAQSNPTTEAIQVFPNPATEDIYIYTKDNLKTFRITNLLGQSWTLNGERTETGYHINLRGFPPGVYFLNAGKKGQKFIINNQ
jgi:hypothetical protein